MKFDAILFDADDTLYDFKTAEKNAISEILLQIGITSPDAAKTYSQINAECWREFEKGIITQKELRVKRFARLIDKYVCDTVPEEAAATYAAMYAQALSRQAILLPGAEEVVRRVAAERPVALVTNGIAEVKRGRYKRSALYGLFQAVYISEEIGAPKPAPDMFLLALKELGDIAPSRALMIGDSLTSDMAGAQNAGIHTCWFNPAKKERPVELQLDYEICTMEQMLEVALS